VDFKLFSGRVVKLDMDENLSVGDYMEQLSSREGIPKETMALIYNRKRLQEKDNLAKLYAEKRG
jgi:hypothetical protein